MISRFTRSFSSNAQSKTIGFLGLGNMGGFMAQNLLRKGHKLVLFDPSEKAVRNVQEFAEKMNLSPATYAAAVKSPAETVSNPNNNTQVDTLITMLPTPAIVLDVYVNHIIPRIQKNALLIDSSTIDPATSKKVAEEAAKKGIMDVIDAPVSGGVGGAEKGTLTFMVGCAKTSTLDRARPFLEAMGKNIVHCGDVGAGQVAKICNNLVLGISMCAISEALALGTKAGLDPKILSSIINTSSGRCWVTDVYNPCPGVMENVPASRNYEGGFGVDLMKKDMALALQAAQTLSGTHQQLPLGALAHQIYEQLSKAGFGRKDFGSVFPFVKDNQINVDYEKESKNWKKN